MHHFNKETEARSEKTGLTRLTRKQEAGMRPRQLGLPPTKRHLSPHPAYMASPATGLAAEGSGGVEGRAAQREHSACM